jgi:hypothetical protein
MSKPIQLLFLLLIVVPALCLAQGVAINNDNSAPDPSAMLDVKSLNQGFLPPRMNTSDRIAILNPANGLMVYDIDLQSLQIFAGSSWFPLATGDGSQWTFDGNYLYFTGANVGIGTTDPRQQLSVGEYLDLYSGPVNNPSRPAVRASIANDLLISSFDTGILAFNTDGGTGETRFYGGNNSDELMRLSQDGKIGIGVVNPQAQLHTDGSIRFNSLSGAETRMVVASNNGTLSTQKLTYSVGDLAQGGVVFWVDETGQHGLVCPISDQSEGVRWFAGEFGYTQAKGDGPLAGKMNTAIIIASQVFIGDDGETYAARICNELQITAGGKTYGDWYLPSKRELELMYQYQPIVNAVAIANGGESFTNDAYWSSNEDETTSVYAYTHDFGSGNVDTFFKSVPFIRVRAVRAF